MDKKTIWVLGSCNFDTTFQLERLPIVGETLSVRSIRTALGGKGANVAVASARSGAGVCFAGCVGQDEEGRGARDELIRCGIDVSHLSTAVDVRTGQAYILVDAGGKNMILVDPGANRRIPVDTPLPFKHEDFLLTQYETEQKCLQFHMKHAKKQSVTIFLNPSPFGKYEDTLKLADYLFLNETEAADLADINVDITENAREAVAIIAKRYGAAVVVTLGKRGALLVQNHFGWQVDEYPVNVRDTQGAGDIFMGVFAASLMSGDIPCHALLRANIAASLSVAVSGSAQQSFPEISEVSDVFNKLIRQNAIHTFVV